MMTRKDLNILKGEVFFLSDFIQLSDLSSDDRQLWMDSKRPHLPVEGVTTGH